MLNIGDKIKSSLGEKLIVEAPLGQGGEGETFIAESRQGDEKCVIKLYYDNSPTRRRRVENLVQMRLHEKCPGLYCAPRAVIDDGKHLGHVSPLAPGQPLVDFLESTPTTLIESIGLAVAITAPLKVLEQDLVGHGDVHIRNVLAGRRAGSDIIMPYWIDFCNYISPNLPCLMMGPEHYSAPELVEEFEARGTVTPTLESDRFSFGVLLADVLFRKHPQHGCEPGEDWREVVARGEWPLDPARRRDDKADEVGIPVLAANNELISLFRLSFSRDPSKRPSAATWYASLKNALCNGVYECPYCGYPTMIDPARTVCPYPSCPHPRRRLAISVKGRSPVPLDRSRLVLGRADLGGSESISRRHLVVVRMGMEMILESIGHNGTRLWEANGWTRLNHGHPVSIEPGDRFCVAETEIEIVEI